jgi:hypothetical protein
MDRLLTILIQRLGWFDPPVRTFLQGFFHTSVTIVWMKVRESQQYLLTLNRGIVRLA